MANKTSWKPEDFPCTLTLSIPFPSAHLATTARRALSVDAELSPLVRREIELTAPIPTDISTTTSADSEKQSVLLVNYAATTNRMLRVAVNGFFESLGVVVGAMRELDVDVIYEPVTQGLEGVQGLVGNGEGVKS